MIELLPEETINQIAAGEVIENPASVVKELIDNSLDAGAREIRVEIISGGRQKVAVIDDGCGIPGEQVLLALERHATSKIRSAGDLVDLSTMGFRGEALASIAAVSRMTLTSTDVRVEVAGGKVLSCEPAGRGRGTTVEVRDLFFNTPVRRRFQRSVAWDAAEVKKVVGLQALAYPEVRFRLTHGDKRIDLELLSDEVSIPVRAREGNITVEGRIGPPTLHKPNRMTQCIFINRRPVSSYLVSNAVREGYGGRLPERRFPVFALFLDLPGELVDYNVHPQKREVRLCEEPILRRIIADAVREALDEPTPVVRAPVFAPAEPRWLPAPPQREETLELVRPQRRLIALVGRYALVEGKELMVVDLQELQRRLFSEEFAAENPPAQMLLIPLTLHLSPKEAQLADEHLEAIEGLGFGMRSLGGGSYLIDAVPSRIGPERAESLLVDLLDQLTRKSDVALEVAKIASKSRLSEAEAVELVNRYSDEGVPFGERELASLM